MWQKGPLPPNTWNWGGVVPTGTTSGFYFADFCGDHVKCGDRVLKPDEVAWFDNSLELPPKEAGVTARA